MGPLFPSATVGAGRTKMTRSKWLLLAAMALGSTTAHAAVDLETGEGLLKDYTAAERSLNNERLTTWEQREDAAQCLDYIAGVFDMLAFLPPKDDDGKRLICVPDHVT